MIELFNLEKQYTNSQTGEAFFAVRDLTLSFMQGKITALLGPSGCGKTTTLKMINRLIEPSNGSIRLFGQDVLTMRPEALRRRMGYVIQQIGLFPHLTVAQNIATVPDLLGQPKAQTQTRVLELLELVGLEPNTFAKKRPSQLSGGQAQRVGVARALAADPPVLLMDEPFGALDPLAREKLQEAFLEIQRQVQKTIVMVTHDIDEALRMADVVALLNQGELEQCGTPHTVVRQPANEFVRLFFGEDAFLRQLAAISAASLAVAGDATGLPSVSGRLNARSVLSLMLRQKAQAVAVRDDAGVVLGVVDRQRLEEV
jgi:osmoprotectant transport system ATP-binding protein